MTPKPSSGYSFMTADKDFGILMSSPPGPFDVDEAAGSAGATTSADGTLKKKSQNKTKMAIMVFDFLLAKGIAALSLSGKNKTAEQIIR